MPIEKSVTHRTGGGDEGLLRVYKRSEHADPGSASALQRPLHGDGHQRGRRLQPLEGPGRHALARGRDAGLLRLVLLSPRGVDRRGLVRRLASRRSSAPRATRRSSRNPAPSSAAATATSIPTPRSPSRPRTTSSCAAITVTNRSRERRTIEVTSYAEVVLAPAAADAAHPAFSNLFVQTEILPRPAGDPLHAPAPVRSRDRRRSWSTSWRCAERRSATMSFETDRLKFLGRGRTVANPDRARAFAQALRYRGLGARPDRRDPAVDLDRCR